MELYKNWTKSVKTKLYPYISNHWFKWSRLFKLRKDSTEDLCNKHKNKSQISLLDMQMPTPDNTHHLRFHFSGHALYVRHWAGDNIRIGYNYGKPFSKLNFFFSKIIGKGKVSHQKIFPFQITNFVWLQGILIQSC